MAEEPIQNLLRAASLAARKHTGQRRADGVTPYFAHAARTTIILRHVFEVDDDALLTAMLLHDVMEDTNTDYEEIADEFGVDVATNVVLLTKNKLLAKDVRNRDYEERLQAAPEIVQIAKLADVYDNLSDRVGTARLPKTLETAKRWLELFGTTFKTPRARQALDKVSALVARIEQGAATSSNRSAPEPSFNG